MIQKKKRRRIGYGPMGTPGAGPGVHHKSARRGSGRLGKAMRKTLMNDDQPTTARKSADQAAAPKKRLKRKIPKTSKATPQKGLSIEPAKQRRAKTMAKRARIKEAGLEGQRVGRETARGQRAQARRDSKQ